MIALLSLVVMSAAQPLPPLDEFMKDFDRKRGSIQSVRADFRQENITADESEVVTGTLFYGNPRRILFRYTKPALTYVFDDLRVYEYDAESEQVQSHDLSDDPQTEALFVGFGESPDRLREAYNIELFRPDVSECGAIGMVLKPKGPEEEAAFKEIRLYLREEDYLPCRVQIQNDEESSVLIDVTQYRVNEPYKPEDTQVQVAEGTEIFQNDQYVETAGPGGMWLPEEPLRPKTAAAPAPEQAAQP
jgi:outer membrane lipoprotein-sorting protein